jgi:hypothetical protein
MISRAEAFVAKLKTAPTAIAGNSKAAVAVATEKRLNILTSIVQSALCPKYSELGFSLAEVLFGGGTQS